MSDSAIQIQVTRMAYNSRVFNIEFYLTKGLIRFSSKAMPAVYELEDSGNLLDVKLGVDILESETRALGRADVTVIHHFNPSRELETKFDKLTGGTWYFAQFDISSLPEEKLKALDRGDILDDIAPFALSLKTPKSSEHVATSLNEFDSRLLKTARE